MDPLRLTLALGPLAIYLLLLGVINLSRRPIVVTGVRDGMVLGLAVAGFVIVGPMELFFPDAAAMQIGPYVWLMLAALYGLCLVLLLLLLRPRLIIYNMPADGLRPILAQLVARLDPQARWAGDTLALPGLGICLYVENNSPGRNISLVSVGGEQDHAGWRRLAVALKTALAQENVGRNPRGLSFLFAGVLVATTVGLAIARDFQAVRQAFFEILRF